MTISYEKLWKLLKENKMQKRDLASAAELSSYIAPYLGEHNRLMALISAVSK